jgi:hypothetical protein
MDDVPAKISKRLLISSRLEDILKESIYHRTHSINFGCDKIVIGNIKSKELKVKLL